MSEGQPPPEKKNEPVEKKVKETKKKPKLKKRGEKLTLEQIKFIENTANREKKILEHKERRKYREFKKISPSKLIASLLSKSRLGSEKGFSGKDLQQFQNSEELKYRAIAIEQVLIESKLLNLKNKPPALPELITLAFNNRNSNNELNYALGRFYRSAIDINKREKVNKFVRINNNEIFDALGYVINIEEARRLYGAKEEKKEEKEEKEGKAYEKKEEKEGKAREMVELKEIPAQEELQPEEMSDTGELTESGRAVPSRIYTSANNRLERRRLAIIEKLAKRKNISPEDYKSTDRKTRARAVRLIDNIQQELLAIDEQAMAIELITDPVERKRVEAGLVAKFVYTLSMIGQKSIRGTLNMLQQSGIESIFKSALVLSLSPLIRNFMQDVRAFSIFQNNPFISDITKGMTGLILSDRFVNFIFALSRSISNMPLNEPTPTTRAPERKFYIEGTGQYLTQEELNNIPTALPDTERKLPESPALPAPERKLEESPALIALKRKIVNRMPLRPPAQELKLPESVIEEPEEHEIRPPISRTYYSLFKDTLNTVYNLYPRKSLNDIYSIVSMVLTQFRTGLTREQILKNQYEIDFYRGINEFLQNKLNRPEEYKSDEERKRDERDIEKYGKEIKQLQNINKGIIIQEIKSSERAVTIPDFKLRDATPHAISMSDANIAQENPDLQPLGIGEVNRLESKYGDPRNDLPNTTGRIVGASGGNGANIPAIDNILNNTQPNLNQPDLKDAKTDILIPSQVDTISQRQPSGYISPSSFRDTMNRLQRMFPQMSLNDIYSIASGILMSRRTELTQEQKTKNEDRIDELRAEFSHLYKKSREYKSDEERKINERDIDRVKKEIKRLQNINRGVVIPERKLPELTVSPEVKVPEGNVSLGNIGPSSFGLQFPQQNIPTQPNIPLSNVGPSGFSLGMPWQTGLTPEVKVPEVKLPELGLPEAKLPERGLVIPESTPLSDMYFNTFRDTVQELRSIFPRQNLRDIYNLAAQNLVPIAVAGGALLYPWLTSAEVKAEEQKQLIEVPTRKRRERDLRPFFKEGSGPDFPSKRELMESLASWNTYENADVLEANREDDNPLFHFDQKSIDMQYYKADTIPNDDRLGGETSLKHIVGTNIPKLYKHDNIDISYNPQSIKRSKPIKQSAISNQLVRMEDAIPYQMEIDKLGKDIIPLGQMDLFDTKHDYNWEFSKDMQNIQNEKELVTEQLYRDEVDPFARGLRL